MNCEGVISWLGTLEECDLPVDTRTERILRSDTVLRASILLGKMESKLMTLHDIEGHSLDQIQSITGLSQEAIRASIIEIRIRLAQLLHEAIGTGITEKTAVNSEGNQS